MLKMPKLPNVKPKGYESVIGQGQFNWKPGVISLMQQARLPLGGVVEARNFMQTEDGVWATRWGSANYGASFTGPVTGFTDFLVYNSDGSTTQWYMIIDNGALKIAKDGGAWTTISGHTYSTAARTRFLQFTNKIFICNGVDHLSYYDINAGTLTIYSALSTPTAPTLTLTSGLAAGQFVMYYQVTAISAVGETIGSTAANVSMNIDRDSWFNPGASTITTSSPGVNLSWPQVVGAVGYNIYASDGISGVAYFLDFVGQPTGAGNVTYTDYGNTALNDFIEVPTVDTTVAPKFNWMGVSNNRLWGLGDPSEPNRLYWGGTGVHATAFSPALGGGWVDVEPGGRERPFWLGDFRNGQGAPLTTMLTGDPASYGSTWHVDLQTDQIGNTTITVPVLEKAFGAFGTRSPYGVIEANLNVYFFSAIGGFFSTGSVPTLFNILSTNETSIMIRPDCRTITLGALDGLCGIEYDRKLFWSVPYGGSLTNNRIFVYDLEKNNWNPFAFDFGVSFLARYTDNNNVTHLLAVPTTGNKLIELNSAFVGDNNVAFTQHLETGIYWVSTDHVQWVMMQRVWYEFGNPDINPVTTVYSGMQWNQPFKQVQTKDWDLAATRSNEGWSTFPWSTNKWSFQGGNLSVTSELFATKRPPYLNKLLTNWSVELFSDALGSFALNQIAMVGNFVPITDPPNYLS